MQDLPHTPYHYAAHYFPSPLASFIGSIIKFPPEKPADSYADLVCTEEDKAKIYEILTTLESNGKLSLLVKKGYLQGLGAQINHVHPLKFLSSIVTHPQLRSCLVEVFGDYFKRNGFMDGLGPNLTREADKGKLDQYIEPFANEVGVPREHISKFFQSRDWEGLVRFFIS